MKKRLLPLLLSLLLPLGLASCSAKNNEPEEIKVLILPKFEVGEMAGDSPGEGQHYYEYYCQGGKEYEISGGYNNNKLYVKDGVALYVTGEGKTNASLSTNNILMDQRFNFDNALIMSVGCAGSAIEYGTMGDVFVISATVDTELGHACDSRELENQDSSTTWFHDNEFDDSTYRILNQNLVSNIYNLTKDIKLETTDMARSCMARNFDNAAWAIRDPQVLKGTGATADLYWKGLTWHYNTIKAIETYNCPDPYAVTEMEDNSIAMTLDRFGLLDHYVVLRDSVNTDVFMDDDTPESLWSEGANADNLDIFDVAMENNFKVGKVVIDAFLNGNLKFN